MSNGNERVVLPVWVIPVILSLIFSAGGVWAGYTVFKYRVSALEVIVVEEKANNKNEHTIIMNTTAAQYKEIISAVSDLKVEVGELKTELRMSRNRSRNTP